MDTRIRLAENKTHRWLTTAPAVLTWLLALSRLLMFVLFITQRGGGLLWLARRLFTCLAIVLVLALFLASMVLWGAWQGLATWF
jgi:uncharacterized membrane protein (DUF485 family)